MGLYGNLTKTKTLLEESSCCSFCFVLGDGKTVEFTGKLLRIRRSRKQRDRCCLRLFCAQSEKSIPMSPGTGSLRVVSQGFCRPFLKTFAAVYPHPTDRPWVSENGY